MCSFTALTTKDTTVNPVTILCPLQYQTKLHFSDDHYIGSPILSRKTSFSSQVKRRGSVAQTPSAKHLVSLNQAPDDVTVSVKGESET